MLSLNIFYKQVVTRIIVRSTPILLSLLLILSLLPTHNSGIAHLDGVDHEHEQVHRVEMFLTGLKLLKGFDDKGAVQELIVSTAVVQKGHEDHREVQILTRHGQLTGLAESERATDQRSGPLARKAGCNEYTIISSVTRPRTS
jgi:hypothetical protein